MVLTTPSEGSPKVKDLNMNEHFLLHVHYICLSSIPLLYHFIPHILNSFLQGFRPFLERDVSRSQKAKGGGIATQVVKCKDEEQKNEQEINIYTTYFTEVGKKVNRNLLANQMTPYQASFDKCTE